MSDNQYRQLVPGAPAPWFRQRNTSNPVYTFDTVAGRYIVMCFFGSTADTVGQEAARLAVSHRHLFNDERLSFFGISVDPDDETSGRVTEAIPGVRQFWDFDGSVSRLYGASPRESETPAQAYRRLWIVLDPALSLLLVLPMRRDGSERSELLAYLEKLPPVSHYGGVEMHAPIIILPNVLEPALCQQLIALYEQHGGEASGFMREVDGKTVGIHDARMKRRTDFTIIDEALRVTLQRSVQLKVAPAIRKAHSFEVTRMERYIVGCYDSRDHGQFLPHRDNTTKGTAHRRFALSVNLNDDFEGGELAFPEYGPRTYKLPMGGAIVFAGALLHTVRPVRSGRRYAFLPFLYDEAAARLREQNNVFLAPGAEPYKANGAA